MGEIVNVRPAFSAERPMRASALVPEALLTRHMASVAARSAFVPSAEDP